jgi:hypothetical protein
MVWKQARKKELAFIWNKTEDNGERKMQSLSLHRWHGA